MNGPNVRVQAKKEMIRERNRILRIKREAPSPLEKAASAWNKKKGAEEREKQKEKLQSESEHSFDFHKFSAQQIAQHDKEKLFEETGWAQYRPLQKEEDEKRQISINMATIRAMAKKLITREWRRALGKPQNHKFNNLEREAASWKNRKEEEIRRKEEIKQKNFRQKKILKEALHQFGQKLRQERNAMKPEDAAALLEETLESFGEILDIEWHKQGCYIWLEPWEEKKIRRISGDTLPVVYRAKIDQNLELASFEKVNSEGIRLKMRDEILFKALLEISINEKEKAEEVLEETLSKIGRIIDLKRTKKGWSASLESWEEMRLRNMKNKGNGPVESSQIEINWLEGKFSFVAK